MSDKTRLWIGGVEVQFVKWTPNAMIYTRVGSQDTTAYLLRGTIQRLMREGMLRVEGERPEWAAVPGEQKIN